MPNLTFGARLLILLAVLGAVAGIDYWRHGARATRWREYAFLLACATAGGLCGAAFDQLSVSLSPEYFEIGKGIAPGEGFRLAVTLLGFRAGFLVGAVAAGVLMVAGRGLPLRRLARSAPWIPSIALGCAPLGLLLVAGLEPDRFRQVLGLHAGLYAGATLGLGIAALRVRALRRKEKGGA